MQDSCYDEDENCPDNSDLIAFMDFVIKSCIDDFVVNIDNLEKENARYRKALEEIEGLATNLRTRTDYHSEDEVNADIDNVLNIINKAKEKED